DVWWLGIPTGLFAGVLLALNPLALPMLGTVFALGSTGELGAKGAGVRMTAAFGAGMVVVYTGVGVVAGQVDVVTNTFLRPYSGIGYLVLGVVLVAIAAFVLTRPSAFCAACELPARRSPTHIGAFFAGIPAGLVNCPACAGIVLGIAASAATFGNPFYSAAVMFALGLGHAAMLTALMWWLVGKRALDRVARFLRPAGAVMLAGIAVYFFWLAKINGLDPTQARLP
ncbi:MAG: cytochrome c biogenesis protein CcdA, partial [Actinomycetota bacterium]